MGNIIKFHTKEDKSMLDILDVARYILSLGPMKHKKLQKICYYVQVWFLVFTGQRFMDTEFEAWAHGPVSRRLYNRYREWGGLTIPRITYEQYNLKISDASKAFIQKVYDLYKDYSADELELLTHREAPWIEARGDLKDGEPCTTVIEDKAIEYFYRQHFTNGENNGSQ